MIKKQKIKQFKCPICKNYFPTKKFDQTKRKLIDNRKYIHIKIVCERCFYKLKQDGINTRMGTKCKMVGLI